MNRTSLNSRSRNWRGLATLLLLTALVALLGLKAGTWLVQEDALQASDAIVVLGGQVPFRAKEAAAIYAQGWAPEVWLTTNRLTQEDEALAQLSIPRPTDADYSRRVLERLGVPSRAIRQLPEPVANTADEMRAVSAALSTSTSKRVIIVTSAYHTRRVKTLWRKLAARGLSATVRYTPDDPYDAEHWWRTTPDSMAVAREWFGILNAQLGFPVPTAR